MKKNTELTTKAASSAPVGKNPSAPAAAKKKKSSAVKFFRMVGIVFSCIIEEIVGFFAGAFKKTKESSLSFKVTLAATMVIGICGALVITLAMMVHGETDEISTSDCVIGAKKHIITASQLEAYESESEGEDTGEERYLPENRYSVTFDFYSKEDVSCVSKGRTVGELIELLGITLEDTDILRAEKDDKISADVVISVDEISYGTDKVHTSIPYKTEYRDVQTIPRNTEKTHRRGVTGKETVEYSVTYINGVETERVQTREYISSYPVSAVIYRGIGGTLTVGGQTISYSYYIDCDSTFYYSGGITASGLPADENVVAVDPRVIPLGTKLYISGIGKRIAADTGGAIKGNIVDICLDRSNPLTATYGRRGVRVYILD